jgi:hypothetical protein
MQTIAHLDNQGLGKFLPYTSRTWPEYLLILQRNLIVCCRITAGFGEKAMSL